MEFIKHPKSVKELAAEVKRACDAYWGRDITEKQLTEIVVYWASKEGKKLFQGNDYRPAVKQIIGKQRQELLEKILENFQHRII